MGSITAGLSSSDTSAAQFGASQLTVTQGGGNTNAPNVWIWVIVGVLGLFGMVVFLKLRRH